MPLLAILLSVLPGLAEVLSFPSEESFGWFAYAPAPLSDVPWLPFVLCGLALWAPRFLGPVGAAATCAMLAVETLVSSAAAWFTIACHLGTLVVLALVWRRGFDRERPALFTSLAWVVAILAMGWEPLGLLLYRISWALESEADGFLQPGMVYETVEFDPGFLWAVVVAVAVSAAHLTGRRLVALMAVPLLAIMAASCWPSGQAVPYVVAGVALLLAHGRPAVPREAPPPMVALALVGAVVTLVMVYFAP
ncbi:hypothetical protein [Nonomuraea dietziae]|uniref:hypothetical protein n=1 Tax=Nonomuraea dietziae TaxID=65515 RepID=UPI00340D5846